MGEAQGFLTKVIDVFRQLDQKPGGVFPKNVLGPFVAGFSFGFERVHERFSLLGRAGFLGCAQNSRGSEEREQITQVVEVSERRLADKACAHNFCQPKLGEPVVQEFGSVAQPLDMNSEVVVLVDGSRVGHRRDQVSNFLNLAVEVAEAEATEASHLLLFWSHGQSQDLKALVQKLGVFIVCRQYPGGASLANLNQRDALAQETLKRGVARLVERLQLAPDHVRSTAATEVAAQFPQMG